MPRLFCKYWSVLFALKKCASFLEIQLIQVLLKRKEHQALAKTNSKEILYMHQMELSSAEREREVPVLIRVGNNRKKLCGYGYTGPQAKTQSYKKLYHYLNIKISETKKERKEDYEKLTSLVKYIILHSITMVHSCTLHP